MKSILVLLCAVALTALVPAQSSAGADGFLVRTEPYSEEVIDAIRGLPVQDEGRVKPFLAWASVTLLQIHERKSAVAFPDEAKFGPFAGERMPVEEWALDVLFYPEQADHYPVFVVTDSDVLDAIGLSEIARRKRDRYSWAELRPGYEKISELHSEYGPVEEGERTRLQNQIVYMARDMFRYASMSHAFDALRAQYTVDTSPGLIKAFGEQPVASFSEVASRSRELVTVYRVLDRQREQLADQPELQREYRALVELFNHVMYLGQRGDKLVWLPPAAPLAEREAWWSFEDLVVSATDEEAEQRERELETVVQLEKAIASVDDPAQRDAAILAWVTSVRSLAEPRGDTERVDMEVSYLKADWFYRGLMLYLVGFILAALTLLKRTKVVYLGSWGMAIAGTIAVVVGIAYRCVLLDRPPILGLYDTLPYIAVCGALVGFGLERLFKRNTIGLFVAGLLGSGFMFATRGFEALQARDTLVEVQAVLRTNFWLATHVTTVTLGYAAAILAGIVGAIFVTSRVFGLRRGDRAYYQDLNRMIYGTTCFGVIFSTVGTILGGIWANDSWGRFWGWDPKENGALLIVLWQLVMLHARMGGYIKMFGMAILAIVGSAIVTFSWGYTNAMGVGLHSYGFQAGLYTALVWIWGVHALFFLAGFVQLMLERAEMRGARAASGGGGGDIGKDAPAETATTS